MSGYNPKFKLKQKVICYKQANGVIVYGRIIGIKLRQNNSGIFQGGGLNISEVEKKGFPLAYCDNVNDCEYEVLYTNCNRKSSTNKYYEEQLVENQSLRSKKK